MENLIFVSAQPATFYYCWQVEVMINNFIEMGVSPDKIHIVSSIDERIPNEWQKLVSGYDTVNFFFYKDTRKTKHYISSIRPNILKQHWQNNSELKQKVVFYNDCDIMFTKPISQWITNEMVNDKMWYGSDTRWYIGHDYIKSKGNDVLDLMCELVGIDKKIVQINEVNSIGAQYIIKNVDYTFWEKVELDSENLFNQITKLNQIKKQKDPNYHELQIWCADMWSILWNIWKLGFETKCHPNLEFSWATSPAEHWDRFNIFHNAGVLNSNSELFYKSDYLYKLPYHINLYVKKDSTSFYYWQFIKKVGTKSVLK